MIKAEMKYILKDMQAYFKDCLMKKIIISYITLFIVIDFLVFFAVKCISGYFNDKFLPYFCALGVIVAAVYIIISGCRKTPTELLKNLNSLYKDGISKFVFDNSKFYTSVISGETKSENVFEYFKLFKIIESKEYIYIFANKNMAFVVRKSSITKGTPAELRELLRTEIPDRYIIK